MSVSASGLPTRAERISQRFRTASLTTQSTWIAGVVYRRTMQERLKTRFLLEMKHIASVLGVAGFFACATPTVIEDEDSGVVDAGKPDGATGCPGAQTKCGTTCTDTSKDLANCGTCGAKCKATQYCVNGKCNDACTAPAMLCGQFCVDTTTDHDNCGACGKACLADQLCVGKACVKKCPKAF